MLWDFLVKQREFVKESLEMQNHYVGNVDVLAGLNEFDAEIGNIIDFHPIECSPPQNHKIWDCYNPIEND